MTTISNTTTLTPPLNWRYRDVDLDVAVTRMRNATLERNPYNKDLSMSVDIPLQFLGTEGKYNPSTLFGVKLRVRKANSTGIALYASVHVQSGSFSQTARLYKDYSAICDYDPLVKRVTSAALEKLWLAYCRAGFLGGLLLNINTHYAKVGVD